ncbi:ArnT family glycosyltransferase [Pedobacter africanus]|uniref:Dolichyl-phosphate-mannose-protein mannosyltransferase n=1 Tax=Pedobacter africanus TaxID=151894 RepID=A0A1W2E090_9SPHI|nr:glycosyltransferase family 39 protein [Pedobacter africanus]SMD02897.1 Dolichyl-phosphate-mannose-protein mannosyltransferase [Pedobacter africanus]
MLETKRTPKQILFVFLGAWTLINVIQAAFVEVHADEAYYWMYSRFLDWGYFDHPPMVALFIKIGDALIPSTLGLRLLTILSSTASVYLLWKMLSRYGQNIKLFILLFGSVVLFHVYGFITTPDAPLFFFTVLFLYLYQRYAEEDKFKWAFLLALVIAGMLYSKYHGILVLFFTILSNFKLLKRPSFWFIVLLAAAAFVPHIWWQIQNNYPSFYYHVIDRSSAYYKFGFTTEYLLAQLALAGPLVGWYMYRQSFRLKPDDTFIRGLKFNCFGIFIFFLISTLKGRVEAHWTLPAMIGLFMLSYIAMLRFNVPKWFERLALVNIFLIVLVRLVLIFPVGVLMKVKVVSYYFGNKTWAQEIKKKAGDAPVIFMDSFQVPSRYNYYTRSTKGFSYDSRYYRKNQYDIWPLEDSIRNKRAYFVLQYPMEGLGRIDTIQTGKGLFYGAWIDKVRIYQKLNVSLESVPASWERGAVKELQLKISNPYKESIALGNAGANWKCYLEYGFKIGPDLGEFKVAGTNLEPVTIGVGQSVLVSASLRAPLVPGKYKLLFSVRTDPFSGARNSSMIPVEIR